MSTDCVIRLRKRGIEVLIESTPHREPGFEAAGARWVDREEAFKSDVIFCIHRPSERDLSHMMESTTLIGLLQPSSLSEEWVQIALKKKLSILAFEKLPRISRAQSMDALSSQANIAGYMSVIEAQRHYPRFFPMMMTSAGSARPAKAAVLGVGVAGLQAIGTLRRLGAQVEAFDVRPEVAEQIRSLGAKVITLAEGETLGSKLPAFDIIITTANVIGKRAPILIDVATVQKLKEGSVIIDLAGPSGGNCACSKVGEVIVFGENRVTIDARLDFAALLPSVASQFFAKNCEELLKLLIKDGVKLSFDFSDEIIRGVTLMHEGVRRECT